MTADGRPPADAEALNRFGAQSLPGHLGVVVRGVGEGEARLELAVERRHMAPNGYLHAGSIVTLADTACGYGCITHLPEGATSFTTIELKTNFLGTAKEGETVACQARLIHGGRMTQVWDAEAVNETTGKTIALFRCTQMVLWPK